MQMGIYYSDRKPRHYNFFITGNFIIMYFLTTLKCLAFSFGLSQWLSLRGGALHLKNSEIQSAATFKQMRSWCFYWRKTAHFFSEAKFIFQPSLILSLLMCGTTVSTTCFLKISAFLCYMLSKLFSYLC